MSGTIIPIMSRRTIDLTKTQTSQTSEITLVKAVDVSQYTEGELYVRVHGGTIGSGAACAVVAKITSPTAEDPSHDFVYDTAMATVTIDDGDTSAAPTLLRAALSSNFGAMLTISFQATQGGTLVTMAPEISIELVVKA